MLRKVLETPWNFDENAYSKNSHEDNAVLTESISSKSQGDYRYFLHIKGPHSNLARRATQGYAVQLRRAIRRAIRSAAT